MESKVTAPDETTPRGTGQIPNEPTWEAGRELKHGSVSGIQVAVTAWAALTPAAGLALILPVMAGIAGTAMMFALAVTFIIILLLNNTFAEFSKRMASAGGTFAWNSAGLGSNAGFVFGWFSAGLYVVTSAFVVCVSGGLIEDYLSTYLSVDVPWWILTLVVAAYIAGFAWRGIRITVEAALGLLAFEVAAMLLLCLWVLISGDANLSLSVFDPGNSATGATGIGLAITFGILLVANYESAATLGEEAEEARRSIARGLWFTVIAEGVFFLFVSWVLISSYGAPIEKFAADPTAVQTIATDQWHSLGSIVALVIITGLVAGGQAAFMAATRVIFSLGRLNVLPSVFARTHVVHKTPSPAIILAMTLALAIALPVGFAAGAIEAFAYFGLLISVAILAVYILTNLGLFRYIRMHAPAEFSPVRHALMPLGALGGLGYAFYKTVHPLPPGSLGAMPWVAAGWAVIGVAVLIYLRVTKVANVDEVGQAFTASE
jgi:amino acid transporter